MFVGIDNCPACWSNEGVMLSCDHLHRRSHSPEHMIQTPLSFGPLRQWITKKPERLEWKAFMRRWSRNYPWFMSFIARVFRWWEAGVRDLLRQIVLKVYFVCFSDNSSVFPVCSLLNGVSTTENTAAASLTGPIPFLKVKWWSCLAHETSSDCPQKILTVSKSIKWASVLKLGSNKVYFVQLCPSLTYCTAFTVYFLDIIRCCGPFIFITVYRV